MKNLFLLLTATLLLNTGQVMAQVPTGGLVGYYPFNGNTNDESSLILHASINGGVSFTTDRHGNLNSAALFNGTDGYLQIQNHAAHSFSSYTISLWFKYYGSGANSTVVQHWGLISKNATGSGYKDPFNLYVANPVTSGGSDFRARAGDGTAIEDYTPVGAPASDGQWHHAVVVFDNAADLFSLYYDGVFQGSTAVAFNPATNTTHINIGRWQGYGLTPPYNNNFNGAIDDIRLYNTAYSQSEVTSLYVEGNATVPTLSEWGLIILGLLTITMSVVFITSRQTALAGTVVVSSPVAFMRNMPFDKAGFMKALLIVLPVAIAGFAVVHKFIGTNGGLDLAGTMVSSIIVAYMVHVIAGKKS